VRYNKLDKPHQRLSSTWRAPKNLY